jgi:Rrf2 family protein
MKLNRASLYALHALAHLAEQGENYSAASHDIARERGIPERFLLKVLKPLVSVRVLLSMKGPNGGYRLAKPGAKITLLEVIEAVEGPLRSDLAFSGSAGKAGIDRKLQAVCDEVMAITRQHWQATTIADLISGKPAKRK